MGKHVEATTIAEALCGILGAAQQEELGLLVCSFSKDGAHIVAGANDCCVYVWHWDIAPRQRYRASGRSPYAPPDQAGDEAEAELAAAADDEGWAKEFGCGFLPITLPCGD